VPGKHERGAKCHIQTIIQMNTEQNYVGGGNFATTPTPTAQTSLQKPLKKDSRRSKAASKSQAATISILHVDVWFDGGKKAEINLTAPNMIDGAFIDEQYYHLRQYLKSVGQWMNLEAYQASICFPKPDGTIKVLGVYDKVDCSTVACNCQKGGMSNEG